MSSRWAYAQEANAPLVLIVPTRGNASWLAAERRLEAELRGLQLRVGYDHVVRQFDTMLPERAQSARAMVAIQVLREADLGILRFWFTQQPGRLSGYQHLEVNLRNADVVSRAVLPVVEAIYDRAEAPAGMQVVSTTSVAEEEERGQASAASEPSDCVRAKGKRCAPVFAPRLLLGPYLATTRAGSFFAVGVGARWRLSSAFTLEGDVDHQVLLGKTTAALHALYEFRNRMGRGVAIGPGVGVFADVERGRLRLAPRASLRTEMFLPVSTSVDLVVSATVAQGFRTPTPNDNDGFFASTMLGLDYNFD